MKLFSWWTDDVAARRERPIAPDLLDQPSSDVGGGYGFGRPAHRPDPNAHYQFALADRVVQGAAVPVTETRIESSDPDIV